MTDALRFYDQTLTKFDRKPERRIFPAMIIECIDRQYSSEVELACRTSPPLDQEVFQYFRKLLAGPGPLAAVKFREESGMLYISAASLTPKVRDLIDALLTSAETEHAHAQRAQAERTRVELHKKERALEAAARALGVPIK